jgi:hypothetical protein
MSKPSYEFKKIERAVHEWCAVSGMPVANFRMLRPCQRRRLLCEHMKEVWKYTDDLIPSERCFRDFFSRLKSDQQSKVGILQET